MTDDALLHATNISIEIDGRELVTNLNLKLEKGQSIGIVGESGSGKSLTCRAFAGTLDTIGGRIGKGTLSLGGVDLTHPSASSKQGLYGRVVSVVPQNSLAALNPLMRIGTHLIETVKTLDSAGDLSPKTVAAQLLDRVGIVDPERVLRQYPHQLSGGMRQRVMIALAIAGKPQLLIADEPTTALDVSVQKEILELLRRLTEESNMALVLVSHDLGVVRTATDNVAVMYAGTIVEQGPTEAVLEQPRHPYTQALLKARPTMGGTARLVGIPGLPTNPDTWPKGCRFAGRCPHALPKCAEALPPLEAVGAGQVAACIRLHELPESKEAAVSA